MNNEMRRYQAASTIGHFARLTGQQDEPLRTNLVDLLADLLHLCDWEGFDFDAALRVARMHHEAEQ